MDESLEGRLARASGRPPERRRMMDLHDGIGNPLEIQIGYAEILLEGSAGALNETQRSLLQAIDGYARALTNEIHSCLDLLEVGSEPHPAP